MRRRGVGFCLPAGLAVVFIFSCCLPTRSLVTLTTSSGLHLKITVELADTKEERERGLMFRENLAEGTGMLFIFSTETQDPFWMKDTPISLDMIFIREGRIVDLIENAVPFSEKLLAPKSRYRMVLEVPAGTVAKNGIRIGDAAIDYR